MQKGIVSGPSVRPQPQNTGHIVRPHDPRIRSLQLLRDEHERSKSGRFLAEGVRFVATAVHFGASIETVILAPDLAKLPLAHQLAHKLHQGGAALYIVSTAVFHSLSVAAEPQGIAIVIRQNFLTLSAVDPRKGLCWIALEGVKNPGNLGTTLRSAEAVGAAGLILIDAAADPYHPVCVRASMGSLFSLSIVRTTARQFKTWKKETGITLVGTSPAGDYDYRDAPFNKPAILLMGSERKGMTAGAQSLCDYTVKIPMSGATDSLNLGVAASILLYEVLRRDSAEGGGSDGGNVPDRSVREAG